LVKVLYALVYFGLSYWLAIKPSKMVERIGKFITPALLAVLALLVVTSFLHPAGNLGFTHNAGEGVGLAFADAPLVAGLIQGYGTMDALASLAFSIVVIHAVRNFGVKENRDIARVTILSGVIAVALLAVIYLFVARIGATSQSLFEFDGQTFLLKGQVIDGGHILSQASLHYLGSLGRAVLAVIVFLACLTTSTGLISACAEYFHKICPRMSYVGWASLFTLIALSLYFIGLSEIIKWSVPVLYLLYPLTIVLIFLSLAHKTFARDKRVYQLTMVFTALAALYDALAAFSSMTGFFSLPKAVVTFFSETLPLGEFALGWLPLAGFGFVLGYIWHLFAKEK
jgi:LIVCS family branched-chain amino acid:cation transporter